MGVYRAGDHRVSGKVADLGVGVVALYLAQRTYSGDTAVAHQEGAVLYRGSGDGQDEAGHEDRGGTARPAQLDILDGDSGLEDPVVERSALGGVKPLRSMTLRRSSSEVWYAAPASFTTFSSIIMEPMSLHPACSAIEAVFIGCVTQLACMFGTLSRTMRLMAVVFK